MAGHTRILQRRDPPKGRNHATLMFQFDKLLEPPPQCEVAFIEHWARIRDTCVAHRGEGMAVFAVDDVGIVSTAVLAANADGIRTAIAGRHSGCDLLLPADPSVSLRHLAIALYPGAAGRQRYRVMDLRTEGGFKDERGMPIGAFEADGPAFCTVGKYALLLIPLDAPVHWGAGPVTAWRELPEREIRGVPRVENRATEWDPKATGVQQMRRPGYLSLGPAGAGSSPIGRLLVRSRHGMTSVPVGSTEARAGILLGRYDRCDTAGVSVLSDDDISRVHTLIIEVQGRLYAIDTASTNGTFRSKSAVRAVPLTSGDELELGRGLAWVKFEAVH